MDRVLKAARASGSLNLSNRSLSEVPDEVYKSLDAISGDEKWWEAVELQKLILAHNDIELLKEDLRNLPLLVVLNVSHNKLSNLPAAIGELHMLKSLDVSFNSIVEIPEEIGSVASLVKFDCSNNRLNALPSSLGHCVNLAELKASNNSISSLPEELANCSKLTKLDVEGNKLEMLPDNFIASCTMLMELNASRNLLSCLPESIGRLSRLIRLDLHQNRISSIPSSIKGCSSLLEFYMGSVWCLVPQMIWCSVIQDHFTIALPISEYLPYSFSFLGFVSFYRTNALSSLPAEIGSLTQLGTFDLQSNQLKEYPVEACNLRLSVLDLSNNSLSGLPPEIGLMTTLRKLLLTGNPLRTLRSSLVHGPTAALLKYLRSRLPTDEESAATTPVKKEVGAMAARASLTSKEISLAGLSLDSVPSDTWKSSEVTKVNLSGNSIEYLPIELRSCISVEALILSKNKIKEWPAEVLACLPKLLCLKLDGNPLKKIPSDGFRAASKLQILDLSGATGSLPENPPFSTLPELQELYLRRMQISAFPLDLLTLPQLRILDLSQNCLQSIPESIKDLTSLTELNLSDNNISSLPPALGLLESNLQVLKLEGNPLRSIRRAILEKGTKAILKYLKERIVEP